MDPAEHSLKEVERNFMTRTMKGAAVGLVPGILWGTLAAAVQVKPPVGKAVVFPGMVPTLTIIGTTDKSAFMAIYGGIAIANIPVVIDNVRRTLKILKTLKSESE